MIADNAHAATPNPTGAADERPVPIPRPGPGPGPGSRVSGAETTETAVVRRPRVFARRCGTCVFRPGNPMTLEPGALAEIVAANLRTGTALVCHLTTYRQRPDLGEVLCRGYFDAYGDDTQSVQVLRRLAAHWGEVDPFEVVDVPAETTPS